MAADDSPLETETKTIFYKSPQDVCLICFESSVSSKLMEWVESGSQKMGPRDTCLPSLATTGSIHQSNLSQIFIFIANTIPAF